MNMIQYMSATAATASNTDFYYSPFESVSEALEYGLSFSLFGFGVVFAILALLLGILLIFKFVFYTIPSKKASAAKPENKKTENVKPAPAPAAPVPVVTASSENELVAVISAAIASFRAGDGAQGGFRVVSFKKRK